MRKLCSHSAKERELNNDVKVKVQTMRPSGKPIRHEKRCNRHEKTIRSPWTSISRSWEIDPSVAKIFEAFRYQLKHVAPSMVKSRVEVISSGDKPFRGDQENHVLVRCTSSNQNWGDKNFRCKIGNAWTYDEICNTLSRNTSSLCLLCCLPFDPRLMLSATVWGGDQATPVPVGANSVQSVAGLEVNLPEGYACALENWWELRSLGTGNCLSLHLQLRQTFCALWGVGANLPPAQKAREKCRQPELTLKGSII